MNKIKIIISLLATTLSLLFTSSLSLFKFINSKKLNKKIIDSIKIAEEFTNYSGIEKKEYVLTKLNQLSSDIWLIFILKKLLLKLKSLYLYLKMLMRRRNKMDQNKIKKHLELLKNNIHLKYIIIKK